MLRLHRLLAGLGGSAGHLNQIAAASIVGLSAAVRSLRGRYQLALKNHHGEDEFDEERGDEAAGPWSALRLRQTLRTHLKGDRVIVLSNREPCIHERADSGIAVRHPASGLVTALEPVMRACSGVWVAHGSGSADRLAVDPFGRVPINVNDASYLLRRVWLNEDEENGYYYGFANEALWPLSHTAHAHPIFRRSDWQQYQRVNQRFADAVAAEAGCDDPIVLVQDYHFALVPKMLRRRFPKATILTFWHIPWPNPERFSVCPYEREILEGLLGSSIVGFQVPQHCHNFLESIDRVLEVRIGRQELDVVRQDRTTLVRPYPISIEWPARWTSSVPTVAECRQRVAADYGIPEDARMVVSVDRLDYTKGLCERLLSIERKLEEWPERKGPIAFVQVGAPSRTRIATYREF